MSDTDESAVRAELDAEREKILSQLHSVGATRKGGVRPDLPMRSDPADAAARRTQILTMAEPLLEELRSVDRALRRLEEGQYGICASCGKDIAPERLEFRPNSVLCVDCKRSR